MTDGGNKIEPAQDGAVVKQKVLIIGSGGREHALAWKLAQSPRLGQLFAAPGNGGTEELAENVPIAITDTAELVKFAQANGIDLTIVGPDNTLAAGVVDAFKQADLRIFGPTQAAARIESSKAFAKELMGEAGVPTASARSFTSYDEATQYVANQTTPIVVKASGLALGKGVSVCHTISEAQTALKEMMVDKLFGAAGDEVIIEQYLDGPEVSIHAFCDGSTSVLFPPAQDHKPIGENDTGPNTGGIGAYAPVPGLAPNFLAAIEQTVVRPTLAGLEAKGSRFTGCLYPGLKVTDEGAKVLEFNARFGDPEAQVYMRLLESDLLEIINACVDGRLGEVPVTWHPGYAVCVVMAAAGYPGPPQTGKPIYGINKAHDLPGVVVFQAGTKRLNRRLVTAGGRVLGVTAVGDSLEEAIASAYRAVEVIEFQGRQYRRDIGAKGLQTQ
ncbi:MAG TPA: phosphoribosylamine--glycine ligase [Candidatus Saccharimonadales bacterium]|nr:phosphoribosylamine--glycine ligase [Candidatus Saccharimonadales bacterium]